MNSGDMNVYSKIIPLKFVFIELNDKNIYK